MNDKALQLLDQIIEMSKAQDKELDECNLKLHRASRTIGQSAALFHLFKLKELLNESPTIPNSVTFSDKTFQVSLGFVSPGLPSWADKLPETLDIGKKMRVCKTGHTWVNREGEVIQHYINWDDCGDWGKAYYLLKDESASLFPVRSEYCELC